MSALSEKVRVALFAKLNVAGVTSLATGGVHFMNAPEEAARPFVVFSRVPADVHYAMANNLVGEKDRWLIKAVTDEDSSTTKEPQELAEDILEAAETAIGTSLTLTGATTRRVRRVAEIPNYNEKETDRYIYHHGFWLEVFTE